MLNYFLQKNDILQIRLRIQSETGVIVNLLEDENKESKRNKIRKDKIQFFIISILIWHKPSLLQGLEGVFTSILMSHHVTKSVTFSCFCLRTRLKLKTNKPDQIIRDSRQITVN